MGAKRRGDISLGAAPVSEIRKNDDARVGFGKKRIWYATKEELGQFRVTIKDGDFYRQSKPLTTGKCGGGMIMSELTYADVYVLTREEELFCNSEDIDQIRGTLHHSTFTNGKPVISAGMMKVVKGKLIAVGITRGHYQPSSKHVYVFLRYLLIKVAAKLVRSVCELPVIHNSLHIFIMHSIRSLNGVLRHIPQFKKVVDASRCIFPG